MIAGFSLGAGRASKKASSVFDPATLSLTGWWRGSYAGSPWTGTASAGSSGSRNLSEATNPPAVGTSLNGFASADFDGTNDIIGSGLTLGDFVSTTAYSGWLLFHADAIGTNNAEGTAYDNDALIRSNGSYFGVTLRSSPAVQVWHYDGAWKASEVAITLAATQLVRFKYDGTNIKVSVNSSAYTSRAVGSIVDVSNTPFNLGGPSFSSTFFNGRIWDCGITNTALSDASLDDVKSYINSRYGLSL